MNSRSTTVEVGAAGRIGLTIKVKPAESPAPLGDEGLRVRASGTARGHQADRACFRHQSRQSKAAAGIVISPPPQPSSAFIAELFDSSRALPLASTRLIHLTVAFDLGHRGTIA
jgi:hypothetical protein